MKPITKIIASVFLVVTISSCNDKDILEPTTVVKNIGDAYEGGTIFYVDGTGQHGLIAAPSDDSTNIGDLMTVNFPFQITGVSGTAGTQLKGVSLDIGISNVNSLSIQLKAPSGTSIYLYQNNTSGANFINTNFQAGNPSITTSLAPFTGTFAPQQLFSGLGSSSSNGTWTLSISNNAQFSHAKLSRISLKFNTSTTTFNNSVINSNISKPWDNGLNNLCSAYSNSDGVSNTQNICSANSWGHYAAKVCSDLNINGYTDWYLPSIDELTKLYQNKFCLSGISSSNSYWSSSEVNSTLAKRLDFSSGTEYNSAKYSSYRVRAIRSF